MDLMGGFDSLAEAQAAVGPEVFTDRYNGRDLSGDGSGGSYGEGLCPVLLHRHFIVLWKRHTGPDGKITGVTWHPAFITDAGRLVHGWGRCPSNWAPAFTRSTGGLSAVAQALGRVIGVRQVPAGFELIAPGIVIEFPLPSGDHETQSVMKTAAWACAHYPSRAADEGELF